MSLRRVEKTNRIIMETVSDAIQNHLSDPRIEGMISVTRVETSADITRARVYVSILGVEEAKQELSLRAIQHAKGFIQSRLAARLTTRTCPVLTFYLDESLKRGFEIMRLIDQVSAEWKDRAEEPAEGQEEESAEKEGEEES